MNAYNDPHQITFQQPPHPDQPEQDSHLLPNPPEQSAPAIQPSAPEPILPPNPDTTSPDLASPTSDRAEDANAALISQSLNTDGTPKRPMNAFMIFARRRRPQVSAANQMMRTGEISKILSKEWNAMPMSEKQFYLDQAKKLKDNFNNRYPDYVYRRRPNNSRKRRRTGSVDSPRTRQEGDWTGEDGGEPAGTEDERSPEMVENPLNRSVPSSQRPPDPLVTHHPPHSEPFDFMRPGPSSTPSYVGGPGDLLGLDPHSAPTHTHTHPHHLGYPDRFDQLAWPPVSQRSLQHHQSRSLSLSIPPSHGHSHHRSMSGELHPDQASPWGSAPSNVKMEQGNRGGWFLPDPPGPGGGSGTSMAGPTKHRSQSSLQTAKSEPFTPTLSQQRPWSSSTSGSSDTSSHAPTTGLSEGTGNPPGSSMPSNRSPTPTASSTTNANHSLSSTTFDPLSSAGYYPSPTSAAAQAQSPSQYFASSSGAGSGSLGSLSLQHQANRGSGVGGSTNDTTSFDSHTPSSSTTGPAQGPGGDLFAGSHLQTHTPPLPGSYVPRMAGAGLSGGSSPQGSGPFDPLGPAPRGHHAHGMLGSAYSAPYSALHHPHHGIPLGWQA